MPSRVSAFVIWALLAASATYWLLRLEARGPAAPAFTQPVREDALLRGDLSRLFGAAPVAAVAGTAPVPSAASRFRLLGVAAPLPNAPQGNGLALISIDGKPARAYRLGARVEGDLQLRSVSRNAVELGPPNGEAGFALQMPPRQAAATGSLPLPSLRPPAEGATGDDEPAQPPLPQTAQPVEAPEASPPGMPVPRGRPGSPVNR